jgi:hypothetical protein
MTATEKDFLALADATGKFASALGKLAENEEERRAILPELESPRARIDRLVSKIKSEDEPK